MTPTWELIHHARPWSTNTERRWHHMERHQVAQEWRQAYRILAHKANMPRPFPGPVIVTVMPVFRDKRRQDVGNCYPAVKAALDGLVDAGVLTDDDPDYVASIVFVRPETGAGHDAMVLRVEAL